MTRDKETMFMQNQNEIGYQIRNCRKYRGFSLKNLSEATGISFVRLSKFERGAEKPTIQNINKIENILSVKFSESESINEEIDELMIQFKESVFYLNMDYNHYLEQIENYRHRYIVGSNYYKVNLIEYIIHVLNNNDNLEKLEIDIESVIKNDSISSQLYYEYKAIRKHSIIKYSEAIELLENVLIISNDEKSMGMIYYHLGIVMHCCEKYFEAYDYLTKAKYIFDKYYSYLRSAKCDLQISNTYIRLGRYDLALAKQNEWLKLLKDSKEERRMKAILLRNMSWVYILMNDYENSLKIIKESEVYQPKNGNLILYKVWCYYKLENYDRAYKILLENKQLEKNKSFRDKYILFSCLVKDRNMCPSNKTIDQAKKVYEKKYADKKYGVMYFYLDLLINLLEKKNDTKELIYYLKIKAQI